MSIHRTSRMSVHNVFDAPLPAALPDIASPIKLLKQDLYILLTKFPRYFLTIFGPTFFSNNPDHEIYPWSWDHFLSFVYQVGLVFWSLAVLQVLGFVLFFGALSYIPPLGFVLTVVIMTLYWVNW